MGQIIDFLTSNKEWIFSSVGVAILSAVAGFIIGRAKNITEERKVILGRGNVRVQLGRNINHGFVVGKKSDTEVVADFKDLISKVEKPNK